MKNFIGKFNEKFSSYQNKEIDLSQKRFCYISESLVREEQNNDFNDVK